MPAGTVLGYKQKSPRVSRCVRKADKLKRDCWLHRESPDWAANLRYLGRNGIVGGYSIERLGVVFSLSSPIPVPRIQYAERVVGDGHGSKTSPRIALFLLWYLLFLLFFWSAYARADFIYTTHYACTASLVLSTSTTWRPRLGQKAVSSEDVASQCSSSSFHGSTLILQWMLDLSRQLESRRFLPRFQRVSRQSKLLEGASPVVHLASKLEYGVEQSEIRVRRGAARKCHLRAGVYGDRTLR